MTVSLKTTDISVARDRAFDQDADAGWTAPYFCRVGLSRQGQFQRRDFRFEVLAQMSSFNQEGTLFAHLGKHEIFTPLKTYPPMNVRKLVCRTPQVDIGELA